MSDKKYLIGIDAGTSTIKGVLFDLEGREIVSHGIPMQIESPFTNTAEQDMETIWNNVALCLQEVVKNSSADEIFGIGITSHGDGTWMMDSDGNPVRKGILWCDGRAGNLVEKWHAEGRAEKAFERCGTAVNTGTQACQIAWLNEQEPEKLEQAQVIFHCKDWIFYKLTGLITTDETDESLPMLNMETRQYDDELFRVFDLMKLKAKFPKVLPAKDNLGVLSPAAAALLGLPAGLPVSSGPMDVSACALGIGAIGHGDGSSILGTAGIHQVTMDHANINPKMVGMTLCHAPGNRWLRLMATNSATPNIDWFLRELGEGFRRQADEAGRSVFEDVDQAIAAVPIGSRGVMYHPYLLPNGERAPFIKPSAKASFTGLSESNGVADLLRAVYEGICFAMFDCYQHMPIEVKAITLSGGGGKSEVWSQMITDVMGTPIRITHGTEFGAKGAAMNLAVALKVFVDYEEAVQKMVSIRKTYAPDESKHRRFKELYAIYKKISELSHGYWDLRAKALDVIKSD